MVRETMAGGADRIAKISVFASLDARRERKIESAPSRRALSAPVEATRQEDRRSAVRLIDLERRARFARFVFGAV